MEHLHLLTELSKLEQEIAVVKSTMQKMPEHSFLWWRVKKEASKLQEREYRLRNALQPDLIA
jgi:hypothetical protein